MWEKILRKILTKKFGKNIWQKNPHWYNHEKNPAWGARNTRVSCTGWSQHARLACKTLETNLEKILKKDSEKKVWKKKIGKKFDKKILIDIITRKIPRGVLATRVCIAWGARNTRVSRVRNPRNKFRKKFEENFDKKSGKKN